MIHFPNEKSKWSWLAGIMDCDACITLLKIKTKGNKTRRGFCWLPILRFDQKSEVLIEEIQNVLGTTNMYQNCRKFWICYATSTRLRHILPEVIPFLSKKREQAILLFDAILLLSEHKFHFTPNDERLEEIYQELQSLHEKGKRRVSTHVKHENKEVIRT